MKKLMVALVLMVCAPPTFAQKEPESPYLWKPKISSVTVFKNGFGFFMREGKITLRDGWCVADAVPPASFGTLAVFSHIDGETVDIVGSGPGEVVAFDGKDAPDDAATRRARLDACKYLKVQLAYKQKGSDRTASGQLLSVGPEYVILQADNNSFAVPLEGIQKLQVLEKPLRIHIAADGKTPAETTLGMAYLRKGVTWIPEYTVRLIDDDTAEITLRGTLVNEAEDLVHCDVNFVVGVPHFLHTDYLAPIAAGQAIRTIGASVAPRELANQIMSQTAFSNTNAAPLRVSEQPVPSGGRDLAEATGNLPQIENTGASDFTVYTRKDLTLRQGEKAIVTLFVKRIQYSHVYRWSPPGEIEHYLVLANGTDSAWTTGPCLITGGGQALSEDLLKYVPKGGKGEIQVTTAINIARDKKETEVDRKLKAYQPGNSDFFLDLVTLTGELSLRNFGKNTIELVVDNGIEGKPLAAADDGKITIDTAKLQLQSRSGKIAWRLTLKPGETRTLTYKYERYVPSK